MKNQTQKIEFTQVNSDFYGKPRYVCHFLELVNEKDKQQAQGFNRVFELYRIAINKARKIGGSKYRGKDYGGGIVFTTYNPKDIEEKILNIKNN